MPQRMDTSLVRGDHAWTPPAHLPCSCRILLSARKGEHQSTLHTLCHSHATPSPSLALLACATARHGWPGEARRRHFSSTSAPPRPQSSVELSPSPHAASDTPLPRSRPWPANSTDGAAVRSAAGVRGLTTMSPLWLCNGHPRVRKGVLHPCWPLPRRRRTSSGQKNIELRRLPVSFRARDLGLE